jgi:hypothetical protein
MASSVSLADHRLVCRSPTKRRRFKTLPDCKAALPGLPPTTGPLLVDAGVGIELRVTIEAV